MKAVVAAFNQKKALVGAFSVITNLRMDLFEALVSTQYPTLTVPFLQYGVSIGSVLFVELVSVIITFVYRHSLSQALQEGIFLSMERFEEMVMEDSVCNGDIEQVRHGHGDQQSRGLAPVPGIPSLLIVVIIRPFQTLS